MMQHVEPSIGRRSCKPKGSGLEALAWKMAVGTDPRQVERPTPGVLTLGTWEDVKQSI